MSGRRPGRLIVVAAIWLALLGGAAVAYKLFYLPSQEQQSISQTGSEAREGLESVSFAIDAFSGYSVLRSKEYRDTLALHGIFPNFVDDGADYSQRIRRLESGETPFAVFTIDALIKACAELGEVPGTIVLVIDESQGADALLAFKPAVPSLDALNHENARILVTADSPSDTLVRVVRNDFQLPRLSDARIESVAGPEEILRRLRTDSPGGLVAYSLWEPYVSRGLNVPNVVRLADSGMVRGVIVDVLVVQREFLLQKRALVATAVESYLQALYDIRRGGGLEQLVRSDAEQLRQPVTAEEARNVVAGVAWKGTADNYAHMGLLGESRRREDLSLVIARITQLLLRSGAIAKDPLDGKPHQLFYDQIMKDLAERDFHPGDRLTEAAPLRALTAAEQEELIPMGRFKAESVSFARGSSRILELGEESLRELAQKLESWHRSYLIIVGHIASRGDPEANRQLALERAEKVKEFLVAAGVDSRRLHTRTEASVEGAYTVSFVAAEPPY